jgi:N-acetylglucosaminylphosphatidylinositol deacetylase
MVVYIYAAMMASYSLYVGLLVFVVFYFIQNKLRSIAVRNSIILLDRDEKEEDTEPVYALLIAHPDDECMFFAPLLSTLHKCGVKTYIICLSNGDADGKGEVREKELYGAAPILGVDKDNVIIIKDNKLKDGMHEVWDPVHVSGVVERSIKGKGITDIYTFDEYGVSGHLNHTACFKAALHLNSKAEELKLRIWALESVSLISKYFGALFAIHKFGEEAMKVSLFLISLSHYHVIYIYIYINTMLHIAL